MEARPHEIVCEVVYEVRRKVTVTTPPLISPAVAKLWAYENAKLQFPASAQRLLPGETLTLRKVRI